MGKKKNVAAAASAGTSTISKDIHDLKSLTSDLVKEVAELRKQIEHLHSRLDSLTADGLNIPDSSNHVVVLGHLPVALGHLPVAEACSDAQITEATYKAESNAMEMLVLLSEHDAVERDLKLIIEGSDRTQYGENGNDEKIRKNNWIFYPIAISAIFFVATAIVSFCKSSKSKK